jgi:hypothetical protein
MHIWTFSTVSVVVLTIWYDSRHTICRRKGRAKTLPFKMFVKYENLFYSRVQLVAQESRESQARMHIYQGITK